MPCWPPRRLLIMAANARLFNQKVQAVENRPSYICDCVRAHMWRSSCQNDSRGWCHTELQKSEFGDDPCASHNRTVCHDQYSSYIDQPSQASSGRAIYKAAMALFYPPTPDPLESLVLSTLEVRSSSLQLLPVLSE